MVWAELDEYLLRTWPHATIGPVPLAAVSIDCGHFTQTVLNFCEQRRGRRVFAVKGTSGAKPVWPMSRGRSGRGLPFYNVGVDTAKVSIMARLRIQSGPGRIHFPTSVDRGVFEQLLAEYLKTEYKHGRPVRHWVRRGDRRQAETLDCAVYSYCALAALPLSVFSWIMRRLASRRCRCLRWQRCRPTGMK
jgi:phage terminase large subunit GpA-like protein